MTSLKIHQRKKNEAYKTVLNEKERELKRSSFNLKKN